MIYSVFFRDNLLELDIYFEEMTEGIIQQVPAYEKESLFGEYRLSMVIIGKDKTKLIYDVPKDFFIFK